MTENSQTRISDSFDLQLAQLAAAQPRAAQNANCLVRIYPAKRIGEVLSLAEDRVLVGRDPNCGLTIHDDSVSRQHALVERTEAGPLVTDLGSTNGTYVNDCRVTSQLLAAGDRLRFGNHIFKLLSADLLETQYYETVYKIMTTDGLTQIANKRYLLDVLERELARSKRSGRPVSLLLFDVDHFKRINDTHGHLAGDEVLQELCRRVASTLRSDELLARYGGEEFAVVLADASPDEAREAAERIRALVAAEPFPTGGSPIPVTISIGLATYTGQTSMAALVAQADANLYAAKRGGRNRITG